MPVLYTGWTLFTMPELCIGWIGQGCTMPVLCTGFDWLTVYLFRLERLVEGHSYLNSPESWEQLLREQQLQQFSSKNKLVAKG